jgi:hypothetical protein
VANGGTLSPPRTLGADGLVAHGVIPRPLPSAVTHLVSYTDSESTAVRLVAGLADGSLRVVGVTDPEVEGTGEPILEVRHVIPSGRAPAGVTPVAALATYESLNHEPRLVVGDRDGRMR